MQHPEAVAALEQAGLEAYYHPPDVSLQQAEREYAVVLAASKRLPPTQ